MQGLKWGHRFSPCDKELVKILQKKLRGELQHHNYVFECDIYGDKEPWMIFDKTVKQTYYVFTKLKRKSESRIERMVGCGTWKEDGTLPIENDEKICIGSRKTFHFHAKPSSSSTTKETNGQWIMHEFSIGKSDDFVLCKIRNKSLDKLEGGGFDPRLGAAIEQILADHDMSQSDKSQGLHTRNLGSMENQPQKKIKLGNNNAAQQPIDTSVVLTSSTEQQQEAHAHYMDTDNVPLHDIATKQGYDVRSFCTTYLSMEEGNQPQHMRQYGGNVVATEQSNESHLLDFPIEFSSTDSIFDGLTTLNNIEDIDIGDYLDNYMPELNSDSQNAFDMMIASLNDQQPPPML